MNTTKVGIGVLVLKKNEILLGKRRGSHGEGEWAFPGGSLEYGESFFECARRELDEEVGSHFKVRYLEPISVINLTEYMPKHYIDIGMYCEWVSGDPEVMEPDKCEEWRWFNVSNLPTPRFATIDRIINASIGIGPAFMDSIGEVVG
jgi:8-oxo-dGTP diphosphatase